MIFQKHLPDTFPKGGQHAGMSVACTALTLSVPNPEKGLNTEIRGNNPIIIGGQHPGIRGVNMTGMRGQHVPEQGVNMLRNLQPPLQWVSFRHFFSGISPLSGCISGRRMFFSIHGMGV
jgi:hypothetical protein